MIKDINFLEKILTSLPERVYWLDKNNIFLGCNNKQAAQFGIAPPKIVGKTLRDFITDDIARIIENNNNDVLKSGQDMVFEETLIGRDGAKTIFLSHKAPLFDNSGKTIGLIGISTDITKYKTEQFDISILEKFSREVTGADVAKEKTIISYVENIRDYLENIIALLPGSIYWKNKEGVILGCNEYMARYFGFKSRKDLIGKTDFDFLDEKQAANVRKIDLEVMNSKQSITIEEPSSLPNQATKTFLSTKEPLQNSKGEVIGILGVSLDITDRKKMEKELKVAKKQAEEANITKTQFIQNMEHDLRTPASGLYSMLHNLAVAEQDAHKKETLELLSNSSEKLLNLLNDILQFNQTEAGKTPVLDKKFDLRQMVDNLIVMQTPAVMNKKLALSFDCTTNLPNIIISDESRIYRILLNLIGNAIKFTHQGFVKISLSVAKKVDNRNIILKIIVADSGIGIPKDKQASVYERFNRGTASNRGLYTGMGLGLTVVKQFIDELGGEIDLVSEVGKGTMFTCLLPVKIPLLNKEEDNQLGRDRTSFCPSSKKQTTKTITQPFKILLVEDDRVQQMGAMTMLKASCPNAQIEIADTGKLAIERAVQNDYEIIFMDVGLPDIKGTEVTKKIRKLKKTNIPIIALTANADNAIKNECMQSGMNDFLNKPLTAKKILDAIRLWVGKQDDISRRTLSISKLEESIQPLDSDNPNQIIDWENLFAALGKEQAMDLLDKYIKELSDTQREIEQAIKVNNFDRVAFLAHRLKGGASLCRAERLKSILSYLEAAAKNKLKKDLQKLFKEVKFTTHEAAEDFLQRC